jgi:membrane-bound lytic murein transglycosylase B
MAWRRSTSTDRPKIPRWQKAAALIPLALLAGAWTASLGSPTTATADSSDQDPRVPSVPTTSFDEPASYTSPSETTFPAISSNGHQPALDNPEDPASASANGIPAAAMAAYKRAEAVMAQADPGCHLSWALVAAIGRVESDHGRFGGNVLSSDGVATPGIYGLLLDGSHDTALIADTDGGSYDDDTTYDRAVGPMQFIPGTWDIVGVDADGDGDKNPQDIDDAALATAVYLCAGTQDLGTREGQRAAVFSYNHSDQYVALVLTIMQAYLDGDFTQVADGLPVSTFIPVKTAPDQPLQTGVKPRHHNSPQPDPDNASNDDPGAGPTDPGSSDPSSDEPGDGPGADPGAGDPTTSTPTPTPSLPDPGDTVEEVVLTVQQAKSKCLDKLGQFEPLTTDTMISKCTAVITGLTEDAAAGKLVGNTLAQVLTSLGLGSLIPSLPIDGVPTISLPGS